MHFTINRMLGKVELKYCPLARSVVVCLAAGHSLVVGCARVLTPCLLILKNHHQPGGGNSSSGVDVVSWSWDEVF